MTAVPWLLAAALCAPPESQPLYELSDPFRPVVRAQSPAVADLPDSAAPRAAGAAPGAGSNIFPGNPSGSASVNGAYPQPYTANAPFGFPGGSAPRGGDPFLQPASPAPQYQVPVNPYGGPLWSFGANGPQPYRYGWTGRADHTSLASVETGRGLGSLGIEALDLEWEYTTPLGPSWIYSFTQEVDFRWWDGPISSRTAPAPLLNAGFSERFYRVGWDFELASPLNGPWSYQLAFNPSINTDLEHSITRDAWNLDGRAILFYRPNPQFMLALGAGYWDRVTDRIIPYAGVVWTPDDRWEFRLVFPEPRITYFLGKPAGVPTWIYARGEYHVESYETELTYPVGGGRREQIELSDWRALLGVRTDTGRVGAFFEAGFVFEREVRFAHGTPGFDMSAGFISRVGLRY